MCEVVTLVHYVVSKPVRVYCDASSYGVGVCLMHVIGGQENWLLMLLEHYHKQNAQIEREALNIVFAIIGIHKYLYGRKIALITDHKPLLGTIRVFHH